ncbi:unnamed protein product [Withania somnifera]
MMRLQILLLFLAMVAFYDHNAVVEGIEVAELRKLAAKNNVTCILVFGDSSVDPGNNNHLSTINKANYLPYGMDLFNSQPTGRFSNGKLATDFIVDMLHGISFASAGSGYDDFTAKLSNALSLAEQREYLRHYEIDLRQMVGVEKASETMKNALYIISMGTNDFLRNYFVELIIHGVGARRLAVVGVPPLGCEPLIRTIRDDVTKCDDDLSKVAFSFNLKIKRELQAFKRLFGIKTSKGCCGTGTTEYGESCKGLKTCGDRTKFVCWDAVRSWLMKLLKLLMLIYLTNDHHIIISVVNRHPTRGHGHRPYDL